VSPMGTDRCWVELSGENRDLALHELRSTLRSLGRGLVDPEPAPGPFVPLSGADEGVLRELSLRLAHARGIYRPLGEGGPTDILHLLEREGAQGASARIRVSIPDLPDGEGSLLRGWGDAYRAAGGKVDLSSPERTFRVVPGPAGTHDYTLLEQVRVVDRKALHARRPGSLAFRQPVTLSSRLARALVNLAEVPMGATLLDPFCGTGAIPREAGLLGHPVIVSDRSAKMLRGSLHNLAQGGVTPELAMVADVDELPALLKDRPRVSALVTDPPYGRASSTGGETLGHLLGRLYRVVPSIVEAAGTLVMLLPLPDPDLEPPAGWRGRSLGLAERVHASLSRYVYRLEGPDHLLAGAQRGPREDAPTVDPTA
jgi:tRNA (guanine10-N2)-dimethyltransferase